MEDLDTIFNNRKYTFDILKECTVIGLIIFFLALSFYPSVNKTTNERTVITTVTDKTVKNDSSDSKYLIYTKDDNGSVEVYEITDSLLLGRFDSSDVYASIETGKKYQFTIRGDRVHFMSLYPNIYEAIEIVEFK